MTPKKNTGKTVAKKQSDKSEFLIELAERYSYWETKNPEYAEAYERLMFAFTQPKEDKQ